MYEGTNVGRHPWFASRIEKALSQFPDAVMHRTLTKNYGLAGGYIDCTFWTHPNGESTRIVVSEIRSER